MSYSTIFLSYITLFNTVTSQITTHSAVSKFESMRKILNPPFLVDCHMIKALEIDISDKILQK